MGPTHKQININVVLINKKKEGIFYLINAKCEKIDKIKLNKPKNLRKITKKMSF